MIATQTWNPGESEIHQTSNAVRRAWSREEREKRMRIAETRQQWLLSMLSSQRAVIPAGTA